MKRERPFTAGRVTPEPDLYRLLLPNAHTHIPKGKAAMWNRHFQEHAPPQPSKPATPTRPQTSGRASSRSHLPLSPRYVLSTPPPRSSSIETTSKDASPRHPSYTSSDLHRDEFDCPQHTPPAQAPAEASPLDLPLSTTAREHVELKACLLAYMHRIDVDDLQHARERATQDLEAIKVRQILARGGILDDGSLLQTTKRKTSFLLRHFFTLGEADTNSTPTKQDAVLHDVIDEWVCRDHATADEISNLWRSITNHIEQSYVLRRQLVVKSDPDATSITIALDCLRKLPNRLPEYRRMLDVIITLVESGLHCIVTPIDGNGPQATSALLHRRSFYFEECRRLREALDREAEERRVRLAAEAQDGANRAMSPLQQLQMLLSTVDDDIAEGKIPEADREALFAAFLRSNVEALVHTAVNESLQYCFNPEVSRDGARQRFFDALMPKLIDSDARHILEQLTHYHLAAFQAFFRENFDAMDQLLMGQTSVGTAPSTAATLNPPATTTTLFQELIERHPTEFASVLWGSPYLTAHVFQESHHLIARVLEHNVVLISHALQQRPDVLLTLFTHTLRDNSTVIEDFLLSHPKAFSDVLLNRPAAVAAAVKSYPSILADLLQASRSTLARVLLSMPELLCQLFKSTPELLAQTIREDLNILPLAFSIVPQSLSDALERHPEYFVDVAHRKPTLVSKLFAKHPDLLLEPLEANPSVFSNFLVYHRKILPDFSDPNFDPSFFQFERKQFVDASQQTDKRLCKFDGKLRLREKIKFQEDAFAHEMRSPADRSAARDAKATTLLSPGQVISEIARVYVKKLEASAADDAIGRRRQELVEFVLDLYVQELGFKGKAQKKLALLLAGAKHCEQESLRIKWFLRFMNAATSATSVATSGVDSAEVTWSYHPLAAEFYLSALSFLVALPLDQLVLRLDEELLRPCLVACARLKQFVEDPIVLKLLPTKEQRQSLLAGICEKENTIHGGAHTSEGATRPSTVSTPSMMLHLEDVLESFMLVWIHHQDTIRSEWTRQFQLVNPDGSGVVRFNVFADIIRAKMPLLDNRAIMKIYRQCEEENDLGEIFLSVDDFSLAMSILQEQELVRQQAATTTTMVSPATSK